MGRRRKSRHDLPRRVYHKHGAFYFVDTTGRWHRLGKDFATAMARYGELNSLPPTVLTMAHVFDRYQKEVLATKAPRTQKDNLKELRYLRHAFGHMRPGEITAQDIYAYMDARKAPVRANREKALLSHVLTFAIRWGFAVQNPCRVVKNNPEKPRRRYVTDHEFLAVYEVASPVIQNAMMLALLTGLRQGDLLKLRLQNLRDDGLEVETGKTGKRLLFEWSPELRAVIDRAKTLRSDMASMHLLCTRKGQQYSSSGFQAMWRRLMKRAVETELIAERFTFHDIRAKAASDSDDDRLLGHEDSRTLNRHYKRKAVKVTPLRPKLLDTQ